MIHCIKLRKIRETKGKEVWTKSSPRNIPRLRRPLVLVESQIRTVRCTTVSL